MIIILHQSYENNGPGKVLTNLKKGLEQLSIPYKENSSISKDDFVIALQSVDKISNANPHNVLVGPNVCVLPTDSDFIMQQNYKKTLVPSLWVKNKYKRWLNEDKIFIWPVGIDTDLFVDCSNEQKTNDCLIYFKRRQESDLSLVCNFLQDKNKTFEIIKYGQYSEIELINKCKKSKFAFVIDGTESQGIAVEEIMSCNLPLFVWDVDFWCDRGEPYRFPATSIPYWSADCGEKIINFNEMESLFDAFLKNFNNYNPRNYIKENLDLKIQAQKIVDLFK